MIKNKIIKILTIALFFTGFSVIIKANNINNIYGVNYNLQANIGNITLPFNNVNITKKSFNKLSIGWGYNKNNHLPNAVINNNLLYTVNASNQLVVVNLQTQKVEEKISLNQYTKSAVVGLAFLDNAIYISFFKGEVLALNITTFAKIWQNNLLNQILSAPLVTEDKLFVVSGNTLVALKNKSGALVWSVPVNDTGVGVKKVFSASVYLGFVVVGLASGDVVVVNQNTGVTEVSYNINGLGLAINNRNPLLGDIKAGVVGYKDNIIIVSNYKTVMYSLTKKAVVWSLDFGGLTTPVIIKDTMYLASNNSSLHSVNLQSGTVINSTVLQSVKNSKSLLLWDVKMVNNNLLVTSSYGDLMFLNKDTFANNSSNAKPFAVYSSKSQLATNGAMVTSNYIVFATTKGNLYTWVANLNNY